jgi:hypothetical protein
VSQESFSIRHLPPGDRSSRAFDHRVLVRILARPRLPISSSIPPCPLASWQAHQIRTSSASDPSRSPQETACPSRSGRGSPGVFTDHPTRTSSPKTVHQAHRYAIIATRNNTPYHRSSVPQRPHQTCLSRPTRPLQHRHDPAPAGPSSMPIWPPFRCFSPAAREPKNSRRNGQIPIGSRRPSSRPSSLASHPMPRQSRRTPRSLNRVHAHLNISP